MLAGEGDVFLDANKSFAYAGIICAVISIFYATLLFAPLAIIFGYIAMKRGEYNLGRLAMMLGIVLTALNVILLLLDHLGVF